MRWLIVEVYPRGQYTSTWLLSAFEHFGSSLQSSYCPQAHNISFSGQTDLCCNTSPCSSFTGHKPQSCSISWQLWTICCLISSRSTAQALGCYAFHHFGCRQFQQKLILGHLCLWQRHALFSSICLAQWPQTEWPHSLHILALTIGQVLQHE